MFIYGGLCAENTSSGSVSTGGTMSDGTVPPAVTQTSLGRRDVGPGESHADSIWSIGNSWFVGDVMSPHLDAYLADGHYSAWLASLEQLRDEAPTDAVFYVGHGPPASRDGVAAQRGYIDAFVDVVGRSLDLDADQRRGQVLTRMLPLVSDHRLQFLIELSIEPVAATLRAADTTATIA